MTTTPDALLSAVAADKQNRLVFEVNRLREATDKHNRTLERVTDELAWRERVLKALSEKIDSNSELAEAFKVDAQTSMISVSYMNRRAYFTIERKDSDKHTKITVSLHAGKNFSFTGSYLAADGSLVSEGIFRTPTDVVNDILLKLVTGS